MYYLCIQGYKILTNVWHISLLCGHTSGTYLLKWVIESSEGSLLHHAGKIKRKIVHRQANNTNQMKSVLISSFLL